MSPGRLEDSSRLVVGFLFIYLVLDRAAAWTGSLYGEAGHIIAPAVILTALITERLLFGVRITPGIRILGFGLPSLIGLAFTLLIAALLLGALPALRLLTGEALPLRPDWQGIATGVFLQGGIAEEVLWRGYLFRHLRQHAGFWSAAAISAGFITAQHLLLLTQLDPPIALAALAVALASSFPLARLFEISRNTVWGVALLHAIIQGMLKVVEIPEAWLQPAQLGWMGLVSVVSWLVFAWRPAKGSPETPPAR